MKGTVGQVQGYRLHQPRRLLNKAMTWSALQRQERGPDKGETEGAGRKGS